MKITAIYLALILAFTTGNVSASTAKCDSDLRSSPALTIREIKLRSAARTSALEKITPRPGFDNLEDQARIEQVGETGPLAFQQMLPFGVSFVQTPAPTSSDPIAVDLLDEGRSIAVHVDVPWDGRRTSTAAFVSLPRPKISSPSKFLVGPEYPVVIVHLHGGGTPTATGRNGMSIAKEVGKRGIPVVGIDLPGHGRATRHPEGLETFKQQADWLMKVVKQLIDPKVKIVISGHSWGGSFALFMHRLSQDPNYSRISQYIAMSPPIDISLGGSLREKLEFEQEYQEAFARFKDRIAAADFEFQSNLLNNGKDSDVGAYFTNLTDLDFRTPPLTAEEQASLKKLTVIVGSADGLVYVGREKQFTQVLGDLVPPSQFILLGPGTNWKSKPGMDLLPTGHNIFDRYVDGSTTLQAYQIIGDTVLEGGPALDATESTGNANLDLVDRAFRHYANYFGFREMLKSRVEFVQTDTDDRQAISKRRGELEEYLRRISNAEEELQRIANGQQTIPSVQKAIDELRARIGIPENINARRAEEELATPVVTSERRALLEAYVGEIQATESEMRKNYVDNDYAEDLAQLNKQFAPVLAELGLTDISQYKAKFDEYTSGKKEQTGSRARLRGELSRLHQKVAELNKKRESRFGVARDARLAKIRTPEGIRDQRSALRENNLDQSPERQAKLRQYVAEYDITEAAARQRAIDQKRNQILSQAKPPGVSSPDEARVLKARQDSFLDFTYVPPGDTEIQSLAREIGFLNEQVAHLEMGNGSGTLSLDKLELAVKVLRAKRASLVKAWEGLWKTNQLSSPAISKSQRALESTLTNFKEIYFNYENMKSNFLLALKESGRLTAPNILALTPEIKATRRMVQHAKQVYFNARAEVDSLRWVEAAAGNLEGPPDLVKKAVTIADDVWGEDFERTRYPGSNSLTQNLKVEEEYLANRQLQFYQRQMQLNELRAQYSQRMMAAGHPLPYVVQRVELGNLFEQPLASVVTELNVKPAKATALSQLLTQWENFLSKVRTESQSKDSSY